MPFDKPYLFLKKNTVVLKHSQGKMLRAKPGSLQEADPNGGKGEFAQFEAEPLDGGKQVKLKNKKSGKYLRIAPGGDKVDIGGAGGPFTVFKVHTIQKGEIKLESNKFNGKYVAVGLNNKVRVGVGGQFCKLHIYRE